MSASKGLQPSTLPLHHMVQIANDLLPIDSAASGGKVILDVGCGPGQVTEYLIEEFKSSFLAQTSSEEENQGIRILASDFSAPMVAQLQARKEGEVEKGNKIWGCVKTEVCDAQDLTRIVGDGEASHAFASLVLFILPEPRRGLGEMKRSLMRGGVGACTSWKESEWMVLMVVGTAAAAAAADGDGDGSGEPKKKMEMPKQWTSTEGVRRELEEVGFVDVQVVESEAKWSFESHEAVVDMILGFPGMKMMIGEERWGEGGRERAREGMLGWMGERFSEGEGALSGVAVVGVGRRGNR
ncbi:putative methyltransferase family protein [Botrytis fragariae]|uniref:Putative methyltransferase family protein n=1 Tax=Botrytis fragariae TaxID=1964551 RepID=A0A8H6AMI8_9HELO|nr:putative methyltransferase family protein [Botrytis fragariae]KAF5869995.1 putative methyltransferase family protein [Botrytis fragariae]